ncbi:hypothetical protein H6A18_09470 [Collinsella tanakaei]|uniref:hypothetical protein n=1 Tax=Collinsella tanakaei TaxID=626935 RepID=UPI00195BAFF1|nr:hypothetical protein [Collinsella tanakaei]MBM6756730.1 hypothetical protein [Collinsella tanakaei]
MSKVEASSIPAILDAIVGSTSAHGDTYLDDESMSNVEKLEAVCGWVCDRINRAYSGDYPKQCASAEQVAHAVRRASGFILDYMEIDRDALLALADEIKIDTSRVDELQLGIYGSCYLSGIAVRIREALGVSDDN